MTVTDDVHLTLFTEAARYAAATDCQLNLLTVERDALPEFDWQAKMPSLKEYWLLGLPEHSEVL
jgi:hypothetical protein